jgi:hypothetical protein
MGFDPGSLLLGSMVLGGLGTATSAAGKVSAGYAKSQNAAYQSQVAANNAAIAQQDATLEIQAGEIAAVNQGLKTRARIGSERATMGAAGIDVNSGSAVDVQAGTAELGMLDALTVRSDAAKRAYRKSVEAVSDTAQSQLLAAQSEQEKTAGWLGAGETLLSGASTVGGSWAKYKTLYG